jgi:ferredoxin
VSFARRTVRAAFERAESVLDRVFPAPCNPLHQLGSLGWFFYWVVAVSGVYLFVFFDTGVVDAYASMERITHVQWYAGGVMRSLHRYASDALVIVMMLHLLREYGLGRFRGGRWLAWFTGIPVIWLAMAAGISGYWLVWDLLAQYVAIVTTEWLDSLPLFGEAIARNFLNQEKLSGRFFTLMVFIHIAVPLILLFVMWIHIQRLSHARVNPPRALALGTLATLTVVSFVRPALSQGPANLDLVPGDVGLDWFYLFPLPLSERYDGLALWLVLGAVSTVLALMPWIPRRPQPAVAMVNLDNCNGCGRCVEDCPCSAITLEPRSDGAPFSHEAVVNANACVACGICTGACPTASPFRRRSELVAGIELPTLPIATLRERCLDAAASLQGERARVLVIGCERSLGLAGLAAPGVATLGLPCIAMLPPAFVDLLVSRSMVDGVLMAACRDGACYHRLGLGWTRDRIARRRDPYLRARVPLERIALECFGLDAAGALERTLGEFRARLAALEQPGEPQPPARGRPADEALDEAS